MKEEPINDLVKNFVFLSNERKKNSTQEVVKQEETIQEIEIKTPNKNSIAIEESQEDSIQEIEIKTPNKNSIQEEDKQEEDDDIERMIEDQEEYEDLEIMLKHNYGLALPENITDENLEKIKSLVFEWHDFPFEEEKKQIESLIMDASEQEEVIQENKQEEAKQEETIQEVKQEEPKQEEAIQENKQEEVQEAIESSFKDYLKTIIAIQHLAIEEFDDSISFNFTIKKADLIAFKQPKVYSSYEHSVKIKKGQEEARKRGKKPGLKKGSKRERKDKEQLIQEIKRLSKSFNGDMNNHELAKELSCSLNRICNYKRQIKQHLKNRD